MKTRFKSWLLAGVLLPALLTPALGNGTTGATAPVLRDPREAHLEDLHQLTFGGENAEGYWSPDGAQLILQSTHPPYKCDQIFRLSPEQPGELQLVSPGSGRTTCSYFTHDGKRVIFSSTHEADEACPPPPDRSRGYVWALYDSYEIYSSLPDGGDIRQLTHNRSYDAEATVCPVDGSVIFTSTRDGDLELYRMEADGTGVKRLTETPGYDGGAFFSPYCDKIVWRASRFRTEEELRDYQDLLKQGLVRPSKLEIWVADADGSQARQVTYLDAASFAPSFFPSGDRIIFSSNHGDPRGREFDLYSINVNGSGLERITFTPQFDGFPMFSPDGTHLVFASNRNQQADGETNLFTARWNGVRTERVPTAADHFLEDVEWLADDRRVGRGVGTSGLDAAGTWLEERFAAMGIAPVFQDGDSKTYRQPFQVPVTVESGEVTGLKINGEPVPRDDFQVTGFSTTGFGSGPVVFAGYGITSQEHGIDDYKGLDTSGRMVLVRRFTPEGGVFEDAGEQSRLSALRYKAWNARQHGAAGLLVADMPEVEGIEEAPFPRLSVDTRGDAGLPVAVISRALAEDLMEGNHTAELWVQLHIQKETTANIVGRIAAGGDDPAPGAILIGAHYDHLGMGGEGSFVPDQVEVHNGADDNASGVAALLEAGRLLKERQGELTRDVYLAAFSAEETGLVGSSTFVRESQAVLKPDELVAMLNLDMVGRLRDNRLTILGGDSANEWQEIVPSACDRARIDCSLGGDGYGPSDQTSFYAAGVPVLHMFTGTHHEYHRPSDDTPLINAAGGAQVARLVADLTTTLAALPEPLTYRSTPQPAGRGDARSYGASLGSVPDYAGHPDGLPGVYLSGVRAGSPADDAGIQRGDLLVELNDYEIRDIYDLVYILRNAKPGEETTAVVVRDGARLTLPVVFGKRGRIR